jgi:hypothetical protein
MTESLSKQPDNIVQVGDFGFYPECDERPKPIDGLMSKRYFIRGNHEDHPCLPLKSEVPITPGYGFDDWSYIPDGWFHPDGIFFVGGAYSIDRAYRMSGPFRFHYIEQLSVQQEIDVFDKFVENIDKIKVIVTHDCPLSQYVPLFGDRLRSAKGDSQNTQARLFDHMFDRIKRVGSDVARVQWVFGHHHQHASKLIHGVHFKCLVPIHVQFRNDPEHGMVATRAPLSNCTTKVTL